MKKYAQFLSALLLLSLYTCCLFSSAQAQEKYTLEYKFETNEKLTYKTEKTDSITSSMPNGQEMTRQINSFDLKTLSINEIQSDDHFVASVTIDSTWSESEGDSEGEASGNRTGGRRGQRFMEQENQHLTFDKYGKSTSNKAISSPLILPLPEKPVSVNDQWTFNITTERKGRFQGETTISGKCLLYDIQQTDGDNVAVIIVNADIKAQGKFQIKTPDREISGTNRSSGTRSSLVYFNIDKGRINEIVTEEETESTTEGTAFSTNMLRTAKYTTKLIDE